LFGKENKITVFDIGSKNIKVLTGYVKDKIITIDDYEIIATPEHTISDGIIINKELTIKVLSTVKVKSKDIRIVISSNEMVLRTFDLPKMEIHEVKEAVKFEMSVLLPERIESYIVDASVIEEYLIENAENAEISMFKVQGVAIERKIVDDYLDCFSKAGYKINIIDIQSNCVIKLICSDHNYVMSKTEMPIADDNLAIIDIGHEKTAVTFVENRKIFLHRILNQGGKDITEVIEKILDLDPVKAEEWKHENDFAFLTKSSMDEVETMLYNGITNIFNVMNLEIYQVIEFFISMSKQKKLDHIIVLGGGSRIPGIDKYIGQYVNRNTEIIDGLHNIKFSQVNSPQDVSIIANALGAFIRRG